MRTATLPIPAPPFDLAALRRGDAEALAATYRAHAGPLLRSVRLLLGDRGEAEDVIHDLFVGLPEAMRHYEDRGSLRSWLSRVAARMALTRLRGRKRRREVSIESAAAEGRAADGERLADRLLVETALARLPEESRTVVVLRDLEGWTYRDIAEFVGASEGTVMTRHCRAMQRLKTALEEIR
jgi:RNA polymerase sigma-70 factor (ECF subfamily)